MKIKDTWMKYDSIHDSENEQVIYVKPAKRGKNEDK